MYQVDYTKAKVELNYEAREEFQLDCWGLEPVLLRKRKEEGNWYNAEGLLFDKDIMTNL